MSHPVHLVSERKSLKPRREPYWGPPLEKGKYLGVRKLEDGTCTWIARMRDADGKQRYKSLGQVTDSFDHSDAKREAEVWLGDVEHGIGEQGPITVKEACKAYVKNLRAEDREDAADDAEGRFKRLVDDHSIGKVQLDHLRTARIKAWRNELGGAKSSQNRNLTALKAALNFAVDHAYVRSTVALQWKAVKPHKGADGRRDNYLDRKQRRALLEQLQGPLRDFVEALVLTGARSGELAAATRSAFDHRTGTLRVSGKTGARAITLSQPAIKLFKRVAKGKLPGAPLLPDDEGEHWKRWDWHEPVRDAVKAAKLPPQTVLYDLRHSWITEALLAGMPTLEVSKLTGTSLQMLENHYGHLVEKSARERLAAFDML